MPQNYGQPPRRHGQPPPKRSRSTLGERTSAASCDDQPRDNLVLGKNQGFIREINTIFGELSVGGSSINFLKIYAMVTEKPTMVNYLVQGVSMPRLQPTMFDGSNEVSVHYPYWDDLLIQTMVDHNSLNMILLNDRSLVDIIFGSAFNQIDVNHPLTQPHLWTFLLLIAG
ncbi:uncharacterized protein Fot_57511 [Forsythia ovata]|uniref:Uncharacterized protein n=1 Tax=Forsythia ovata TaxID=205694 RepID=A0ABD1NV30_9LAMI